MTMHRSMPDSHFLSCGSSEGMSRANALDAARVAAGVGNLNLLQSVCVVPPGCTLTEACRLPDAEQVPAVCASIASDLPGEVISAGVAVAYPVQQGQVAVVMEHAASGHKEDIEALVRRMAEEGLRMRGLDVREVRSIAVQHRVESVGAAVATLVLWNR